MDLRIYVGRRLERDSFASGPQGVARLVGSEPGSWWFGWCFGTCWNIVGMVVVCLCHLVELEVGRLLFS